LTKVSGRPRTESFLIANTRLAGSIKIMHSLDSSSYQERYPEGDNHLREVRSFGGDVPSIRLAF